MIGYGEEDKLDAIPECHAHSQPSEHAAQDGVVEDIGEIGANLFFVAASPVMRQLRTKVGLLAKVNTPVLIVGESGSGKEIVARLIHKLSFRSGGRFLKVNCAALPEDLLESEFFGYERGAFTGAMRTKHGKFELCDRGTILLDEIAEMAAGLQAKLLHVLQDKQFFRLGGESTIEVDVRILAATNVRIAQALTEGRLREDLYYRLSTFTLEVPPLRERKDEIPLLLGHFMNLISKEHGLPARPFSGELLEAAQCYSWPGNLRELENFVERYVVMGDDSVARKELEPKRDSHNQHACPTNVVKCPSNSKTELDTSEKRSSLKTLVRNVQGVTEKNAITSALAKTNWNRKAAAQLLSISYRGLLYKIQQYALSPPPLHNSSLTKGH